MPTSQFLDIPRYNHKAAQSILKHIFNGEYSVLLGPRYSGKGGVFECLDKILKQDYKRISIHIDLRNIQATTQREFFTRLLAEIYRKIETLTGQQVPIRRLKIVKGSDFRNFLRGSVSVLSQDIILLIGHIEAIPNDLIQALLKSLRVIYTEQQSDSYHLLVSLSGALSFADFAVGETSPFNIAQRVFVGDLSNAENETLLDEFISSQNIQPSKNARHKILLYTRDDPGLLRKICKICSHDTREETPKRVSVSTVNRAVSDFLTHRAQKYRRLQEAIQLIEDDPRLLEAVLLLLNRGIIFRRELKLALSPDLDPFYLTGMVRRISEDRYEFRNQIYAQFLDRYFSPERVGQLFMVAGQWNTAIEYLEKNISQEDPQEQPKFLTATIQAMYASNKMSEVSRYLTLALKSVFKADDVTIWRVSSDKLSLKMTGIMTHLNQFPDQIALKCDTLETRAYRDMRPIRGTSENGKFLRAIPLQIHGYQPLGIVTIQYNINKNLPTRYENQQLVSYINQSARAFQVVATQQRRRHLEKERLEFAETLQEISRTIGISLKLDEVLKLILGQMERIIPFITASIQLPNETYDKLKIIASKGFSDPKSVQELEFPFSGRFPNITVWKNKKTLRFDDIRPHYPHFSDPRFHATRVVSWLGAPLIVDDKIIGVITLDSFEENAYSEIDETFADIFAGQVAIAINNAQLYEEVENRTKVLSGLLEGNRILTKRISDSTSDVLNKIAEVTSKILHAPCAVVYPYIAETKSYDINSVGHHGLVNPQKFTPKDSPREYGKSVSANILQQGTRIVENVDIDNDQGLKSARFINREEIKAFIGIPLRVDNEPVGFLFVNYRTPHHFNPDELLAVEILAGQAATVIKNSRRYQTTNEALSQRVKELEIIREVDEAVIATLDLEQIFQRILNRIRSETGADSGTIQLLNSDGKYLRLEYIVGEPLMPIGTLLKIGEGITGKVVKDKKTYSIPDVQVEPWRHIYQAYLKDMRAELAVPMIFNNKVIGILNIESATPYAFNNEHQRLLEAVAKPTAIAIHNAQAYAAIDKQKRHLKAVHEASKIMTKNASSPNTDIVLQNIVEQAVKLTSVDGEKATWGALWLYDEVSQKLNCKSIFSPNDPKKFIQSKKMEITLTNQSEKIGIVGRTFQTRHSRLVNDISVDPDYLPHHPDTKSELDVPLLNGENIVGVLSVEHCDKNSFDEDDRESLENLADLAMITIRNTEQFKQLNRANTVALMGAWGADVAHEISREIGTIRRNIYLLLQMSNDSSTTRKRLETIDVAAERLALPLFPEEISDGGSLINEVVLGAVIADEVRRLEQLHSLIGFCYEDLCPGTKVGIHEQWVRRLIRHLVNNAVKAIPVEKTTRQVTVRTKLENTTAKIEVEDTGKGVRAELKPTLFQEPVVHSNRSGRGLLLVKFIAEQHGGTAKLEWSMPGEGACFAIYLPQMQSALKSAPEKGE